MRELNYPFDSDYILKKKKSIKKTLLSEDTKRIKKNIALLGGSTTSNIKLILELFLLDNGIEPSFYESGYDQYYQEAIFSNSELEQFIPDVIYLHTSNRNITEYPDLGMEQQDIDLLVNNEIDKFHAIWNSLSTKYNCVIIQNNFEYPSYRLLGNKEASDPHGKINFINRLNEKFYAHAQNNSNFFINDINYLSSCFGLEKWNDPFYWHMYKYSPGVPAIPTLAHNVSNIIKSIYGKNKKALVLDLDNTLWGGIVGDDGVEKLELGQEGSLGQAYIEFQEYIKAHKQLGVLLNIASKNEHENAIAGLNHPDGRLKPDDFVSVKANWDPKSKNIIDMAEELTLLPESFVFVDDNPAEREIVRGQVSGIAVPEIQSIEGYISVIDKSGFFEVTNLSEDDKNRSDMYKKNLERQKSQASFENYEEYLMSLDMSANVEQFNAMVMPRISQLTNKSNQFNLTTKRYSLSDIESVAHNDAQIHLYGKLVDKFGDNGVVSVVIGEIKDDELHMDLWIMSCRVLKRDMELAMMDQLVNACRKKQISKIYGYYYPTAKNNMVRAFYGGLGFEKIAEDEDGNSQWLFIIDEKYKNKNNVIEIIGG